MILTVEGGRVPHEVSQTRGDQGDFAVFQRQVDTVHTYQLEAASDHSTLWRAEADSEVDIQKMANRIPHSIPNETRSEMKKAEELWPCNPLLLSKHAQAAEVRSL